MSKAQWIVVSVAIVAVAALLYVVVGGASFLSSDEGGAGSEPDPLLESEGGREEHVVRLEGAAGEATGGRSSADALPEPVDLGRVDRDRDLHGVVVRADSTPVAGAVLQSVYYPWRYGRLLTDGEHSLERLGPKTRSARDGTFSLPLRPGDQVHLRASASGLATTEHAMLQAGERVRVVLHEPVRLIVKALTPSGEPAADLELRIFRGGRGALSFERSGTTGPDGRYVFGDLPPSASAYLDPRPRREGWGDPGWISVELPASGEITQEVTIPQGRTLRGTVTDATTDEPIAGARVGMNWVLIPETKTDAQGKYTLPGWSGKGVSDIHVLAEGYGREKAEVESKEVLDFALVRGTTARGRVLDREGRTISGAQVMAVGSERGPGGEKLSMDHAWSDEEGRFALTGLRREMSHVLTVIARGFAQGLGDIPPSRDGGEIDMGDYVLRAPRTLLGTLMSSDQEPIPRVLINLRIDEPGMQGYRRGRAWERRSDDLGRFRFEDLPVGAYTVSTRPQGGTGVSQRVQLLDRDEPTRVALVQEAVRDVLVQVVDESGKPVPKIYLIAQFGTRKRVEAFTDSAGRATLRLPALVASVKARLMEGSPYVAPLPLDVNPGLTECTIALKTAAITTGTLLDPSGKPLPWASLKVKTEGRLPVWVWTDEEGGFRISTEPGAVFPIVFEGQVGPSKKDRYRTKQQPMSGRLDGVRAGSEDIALRATAMSTDGSISVLLLDPDGNPVESVFVGVDPHSPASPYQKTDAEGRARFDRLWVRKTSILIHFSASPEQPWLAPPGPSALPEGQEVVLRLRRGAQIQGHLVKADGTPAGFGSVTVMRGKQMVSNARSDKDGHFVAVVEPDDPGPFTLRGMVQVAGGNAHGASADGVQPGATGLELKFETLE